MSTPLAELRALNIKKQRAAREEHADEAAAARPITPPKSTPNPDTQYDSSYDNMTSHIENQSDNMPAVQQTRKPAAIAPPPALSMAEALRATVGQGGTRAVQTLKTVTIKLAPELDRRVEEHCFTSGRKKQDVVRDALLLYFETIETIASEEV